MSVGIGLGLFEFPFSSASSFWRWVDLCEAGGVDSLWQSDRLVSQAPMLECMSLMAALAGATRRIKFGMNVASVGLRDPLLLAKQCATIDVLSNGRLLPAFGIGNIRSEDWRATTTPTQRRGRRTDEGLDIIAGLWRGGPLDYAGEFHRLAGAVISPRPAQRRLPLWIGGDSDAAIRRTARIGTGWLGARITPAECANVVARIKSACLAQDRRIDDDHYGVNFSFRFGRPDDPAVAAHLRRLARRQPGRDPRDSVVIGNSDDMRSRILEYIDAGVFKFVLHPLAADDDEWMTQTRRLIDELLPEISRLNDQLRTGSCRNSRTPH